MTTTQKFVEEFFPKLGAKNLPAMIELFADDIDWFVPGALKLPWAGKRTHKSEIEPYFNTLWPLLEPGKSQVEPGKLLVDGNDAVAFSQLSHVVKATGKRF